MVKRAIPYISMGEGMKSILLHSIHLLKPYYIHKLVLKCNGNMICCLKLRLVVTIQDMLIVNKDDCGHIMK